MISATFQNVMLLMPFITNAFIYLQAFKIWKRQSHDDLSFLTVAISILGATVWGYYGWAINSIPLLLSGVTAALGFALILALKLWIPSHGDGWRWI